MIDKLRLCISTQTPFIRFNMPYEGLLDRYDDLGDTVELDKLTEGKDYNYTPGGVTAMVFPLLRRLVKSGVIKDPVWVSLGPNAPPRVVVDEITLQHVTIPENDMSPYTVFKEGIWKEIHGLGQLQFKSKEYKAYLSYNWICACCMLDLREKTDLYFIHDFQQLPMGNLLSSVAPTVFQWHIPFQLETVTERLRTFIVKSIEGFDSIIVSTRRDLEGLIHAGYRGRAYQVYPYIEEDKWSKVSERKIKATQEKFGLDSDDEVVLVVGRMDEVKSQDIIIRAASKIIKRHPHLKIVLVGNGSFTGSQIGGLAHPKAITWKSRLESLATRLKIRKHVIFTGHIYDGDLGRFYSLAKTVVVPSRVEGFNLTTVEGWLHKKPVIVSSGAGSSELVNDQVNGYTFNSGDIDDLAAKLGVILSKHEESEQMGVNGFDSAKQCFVEVAVNKLQDIFKESIDHYKTH